ncbi:MAG: cytochrome [Phenylobacterium sp.]|nr:cytochrome [Phenylobacterium sp.]
MDAATQVDRMSDLDTELARVFASDPEAIADPFPLWNRLRNEAPVHYFADSYLVSGNLEIRKVISAPAATHDLYHDGKRAKAIRARLTEEQRAALDEVSAFEKLYMSRNGGEVHDRLRRIAQRTFTARRIAQIEQIIQVAAGQYLDDLATGPVVDFMTFAYRLPLRIIGDMMGVPERDLEKVHGWSGKLGRNRGGTDAPALMEAHAALREFRAYIEAMIADLRARPRTDDDVSLVGDLLDANQGETLSDPELAAMFVVLLFAGHETTTNLIGSGLQVLLQTGQWRRLVANPEIIPQAVEELVRFVTPVQWVGRSVSAPMEIGGHRLERGDTIQLMLAAANRDPEVFRQPDVLDVDRATGQFHLGFGMGSHICLGSHLARMEAIAAFSHLVRRFPDLKLASDDFTWTGHAKLRSLVSLPIELGPERS